MKPINELVQKVHNQTIARKALTEMQAGLELIYSSINTMDAILPDLERVNNYADETCNYGRGQIEEAIEWLQDYLDEYNNIATSEPSGDVDGLMHKTGKYVRCCRWEWSSSQDVDCDGIEVTK